MSAKITIMPEDANGIAPVVDEEEARLIEQAWRDGQLAWMLRPQQLQIYETVWGLIETLRAARRERDDWTKGRTRGNAITLPLAGPPKSADQAYRVGVVVASRKIGKSFLEVLIAGEFCLRYPRSIVRITAPTAVEARSIFEPEFEKVFQEAPAECKPRTKGIDRDWVFPNGSRIVLRGADMKPNRLRGPSSDLNLVDEASYVGRLQYVVNSILYPMTINTKGATILCSTLNQEPSSEFNAFYEKCAALGQAAILPITEAGFTEEELRQEREAVDQVTWEIEYLCQMGRDPNVTIVPEWTPEVASACTVDAPSFDPRHPEMLYWQRLAAIDYGTVDNTVILTGYFAFDTQILWITNEELLVGAEVTAGRVAECLRLLEAEDAKDRPRHPDGPEIVRAADHNIEMNQSLTQDHGLLTTKINKSELENMVNMLRTWVKAGRVKVSPKCTSLIACLKNGTWTTTAGTRPGAPRKRVFARTSIVDAKRRPLNHFDALAAAIYMCIRAHSIKDVNPIPGNFITQSQESTFGLYSPERFGHMVTGQQAGHTQARAGWAPPNARKKR